MQVALYMALRRKDPFFDWQILRSRCSSSYSIPRLNTGAVYQLQQCHVTSSPETS